MNSKERSLNAMSGNQVDRVPVSFYRHFFDEIPVDDDYIRAVIEWAVSSRIDMVCIETEGFLGYPLDLPTKRVRDLKGIKPVKKTDRHIVGQVDRAKKVVDTLGKEKAVYYMIYAPFALLKHTVGKPFGEYEIMNWWAEDKQLVLDSLKYIEEASRLLLDSLKEESGIDGMFISFQNAEVDRFSAAQYKEYLREGDVKLLSLVNELWEHNIVHMCSWTGKPNRLDLWKDYDYETVNWGVCTEYNMSLAKGRDYFRKGTTLMGGFDNRLYSILYNGTKQEVKDYTKNLISSAGRERLILSADCSILHTTEDERIHWIIEACEEYETDKA